LSHTYTFKEIIAKTGDNLFFLLKKDEKVRLSHISFVPLHYNLNLNLNSMKISHIEHLGIAVQSIEESLPFFTDVLGLECYATEVVEDQKVKTAFLKCGEVKLELLEPTSPESTIQKWLDKGNKGVHHVAFCIEDGVANSLAEVSEKGVRLIDEKPRKGAEGLNIAFLHPKSTCGILTELCEHPE
jgi:methylmalonyl-CoA/ethylmalonyl-CoA epimerase